MEETKPKRKKLDWLKDYVINDVSPAETWFDHIVKRRPHLRRWQWYISIMIEISFFAFLILAMKYGADQCIFSGLEQLNKSCEICLNSCVKQAVNSSPYLTKTTLALVVG